MADSPIIVVDHSFRKQWGEHTKGNPALVARFARHRVDFFSSRFDQL